jgi:hypothetical protein
MAEAKNLRCNFEVPLDGLEVELAHRLGGGDLTLGIRRAVVFASMREFFKRELHCSCRSYN